MQNEQRLIDANALKGQAVEVDIVTPPHNHYCSELVVFDYDIDAAPTIDAVPVVRCMECAGRKKNKFCIEWLKYVPDDGFCHLGERKEDNNAQQK